MAITKLGDQISDLDRTILRGTSRAGRGLYRPLSWFAKGLYGAGRLGAKAGITGIRNLGSYIGKNPIKSIPTAALAMYLPYKAKDRFQRNMHHSDPNMQYTQSTLLGSRYYNKPMMRNINKNTSFIY